jgi:hypothetical protein
VALSAAALLQYAFYSKGGHETLADVPGRFIFWRLGWHSFPYLDRGVEYPVVVGYLSWILASLTGSTARFFLANGVIDVFLAVAMTCMLRERGGRRIWRWIAAPALVLFAFHNWDLLALVPTIIGLYAFARRDDRLAGASLAFGASTKVLPGACLVPLAVQRWCQGDRRGAMRMLAWAAGVLVVLNGPMLVLDGHGWWYPARFQGDRSATWGTLWFWLFRLPPHFVDVYAVGPANVLAALALLAAVVGISVLAVRRNLDPIAIGAATIGAFLLANKVYSPNYDIWLVPFFVLLPLTRRHWLAYCVGSTGVYLLVYGYFRDFWGVHTVEHWLWPLVLLRAGAILLLIVVALGGRVRVRARRDVNDVVATAAAS